MAAIEEVRLIEAVEGVGHGPGNETLLHLENAGDRNFSAGS